MQEKGTLSSGEMDAAPVVVPCGWLAQWRVYGIQ